MLEDDEEDDYENGDDERGRWSDFFLLRERERDLINARALLSLSVDLLAPGDPPAAEPAQHRCKTAESQGVFTQSLKFTS